VVRQEAESATFNTNVEPEAPDHQVTITLTLSGLSAGLDKPAQARSPKHETPGTLGSQLRPKTIGGLVVPNVDVAGTMTANTGELLKVADAHLQSDPKDGYVQTPRNELRRRIADLMREVTSKQHERFASAAACLVMILTGAVMAIKLRAKLPLAVYLWAFFPALATVITISAGQQMIHAKGLAGIPVMWAGVAGLAAYTFVQFRQVARH
jgi:hypothetical protein